MSTIADATEMGAELRTRMRKPSLLAAAVALMAVGIGDHPRVSHLDKGHEHAVD
jgi:hypothetical protein